ncbi:MAG: protein YebE [Desulfobulbus propionicus]|nr:MAG: protein YebE [Desulfobulbus propionicus]
MINTEKLLGKVLGEITGTGYGKKGKNKKKTGFGAVTDQLTTGKGLMAIIGLGVGAYEIYRQRQKTPPLSGGSAGGGYPSPPPPVSASNASPPPPLPSGAAPAMPTNPAEVLDSTIAEPDKQNVSLRMIQVMIAAAHADGTLDETEEQRILEQLQGAELTREETLFLLDELHNPKSVEELVQGMKEPSVAKTMYMLAATAMEIDTEAERLWLDRLGEALGLSSGMQAFLQQQRED